MKKALVIVSLLIFLASFHGWSQPNDVPLYHFKFKVQNRAEIDQITQIISIDNVSNDTVYAYANASEFANFQKLELSYELIPEIKTPKAVLMATTLAGMANWDKYPTYEVYEQMLNNWVTQYPNLCILEEIGTLQSGRKLWVLKISDNPANTSENEPKIWLSSSMHGDEVAGYALLLRLIDFLLSEYTEGGQDKITQLISTTEIWISPLTNPDGTYNLGNATISGATRYNANSVDLNRNFPDPAIGENPDRNTYQPETLFLMDFAANHKFSLGANIHGGVEVVNYPWDTWYKRSADNLWWKYVGGNYRDSAQKNSPTGYFTSVSNGLTNGYDWYRITGGRQDYMNYFHRCREFTIEISKVKLYPSTDLPNLWNYNKGALLGYVSEALNGIHGNVIDNLGNPIYAKIQVLNYDADNSEVFTDSSTGFFTRYLKGGTYKLKISADGFVDKTIEGVTVVDGQQTYLKQNLTPIFSKLCVDSNAIIVESTGLINDSILILLVNCGNYNLTILPTLENNESTNWISLNYNSINLSQQEQNQLMLKFNNPFQNDTSLSCTLIIVAADTLINIPVTVKFKAIPILESNKTEITQKVVQNTTITDSIVFENTTLKIQQIIVSQPNVEWLKTSIDTFIVNSISQYTLYVEFNANGLTTGLYSTKIEVTNGVKHIIPVNLFVEAAPQMEISHFNTNVLINKNSVYTDTFLLSNSGGGILDYKIEIAEEELKSLIEISPTTGIISKMQNQAITIKIESSSFKLGNFNASLMIGTKHDTVKLPLEITIDTLPYIIVSTDTIKIKASKTGIYKDSIRVENMGGAMITISAKEKVTQGYSLVSLPNSTKTLVGKSSVFIPFSIASSNLLPSTYYSSISLNEFLIPIEFTLSDATVFTIDKYSITGTITENETLTDTLKLSNNSEKVLTFAIENDPQSLWFKAQETQVEIAPGEFYLLLIDMDGKGLSEQTYFGKLTLKGTSITRIPITLIVKNSK